MSRLIVLDSGLLGMVTNPKAKGVPLACQQWLKSLKENRSHIDSPGRGFCSGRGYANANESTIYSC
jgi:hypothetical protein